MPKTKTPKTAARVYRAASYARLSVDDESYGTSGSVLNQHAMIRDFADANGGLSIVAEYSDDGFSGSTFENRPGWGSLLADVEAGKIDCIVVRDKHAGAPYIVTQNSPASVICAGDGKHNHPTQALLDLYTIWEHKGDFHGLKVAVVGDIAHSRVCGSLIPALKIMGCETYAVAPGTLLPPAPEVLGCDHVTSDLDSVLPELDVVYMLRVQQERLEGAPFPTIREYHKLFGLTKDREKLMKPDAIICHPGPINRGVEFDSYMADHPQRSVILEQVYAGICVRMAILYLLLGGADNGLAS